MKRIIIAILIVAAMLLVSGCAQNGDVAEEEIGDVVAEDTIEDANDLSGDVGGNVADSEELVADDEVASTETENISSVSQEDLDNLKEELEGLEFEDMGGLSE